MNRDIKTDQKNNNNKSLELAKMQIKNYEEIKMHLDKGRIDIAKSFTKGCIVILNDFIKRNQ